MDTPQFNPVTELEQIETVCQIADEVWHQHFTPIIGAAQVEYMLDQFQSVPAVTHQLTEEGYRYWLIVPAQQTRDDLPAGYVAARADANEGALFLSKLYLRRAYRGRGYASAAIRFLTALCERERLSNIWLTVNRDNTETIAKYYSMGFQKAREQKTDIGSGFYMDDFIMEMKLHAGQ